jgi:hypothetical protein
MKFKLFIIIFLLSTILIFAENEKGLKIKEIKGNEGKRWAICVGINDYEDENITDLKKAQNDATALADVFIKQGQFDKVVTLINDYSHYEQKLLPTKANIERMLDYILEFSSPDDLVVFSFSGHGISDKNGEGYLITQDTNLNSKFETSLKISTIASKLKEHKIKKSLLLLDACREELTHTKGMDTTKGLLSKEFRESEVAAAFYSTKAGWFSYEDTESDYGVFTRFVLEGLTGKADSNNDNIVSFIELENFVEKEVNDFSLKNNRKQKPYTKIYGEKFGDLALTISKNITHDLKFKNTSLFDVANFRSSLKAGEENSTIILSWSPPENKTYDGFILLRQENKQIDFVLENNVQYIEGEKISNSDITVIKKLPNNVYNFIDNNLKEGVLYYYKIFSYTDNNNSPVYSQGVQTNLKTNIEMVSLNVKLDSIRVITVNESSWGAELYWTIKITTSNNDSFVLDEKPKDKYWAAVKDDARLFKNFINLKLPKNGNSFFEIIVDMRERDDIKDGWYQETGGENHVIKKKVFRYYINDSGIYGQQSIIEEEKNSAKVELKWTISKVD